MSGCTPLESCELVFQRGSGVGMRRVPHSRWAILKGRPAKEFAMRSNRLGSFMLAMVSAALLAVPAAAEPIKARRPNVLIVLTDDLGWADLGCYGCTDIRTPNVDKLARQSV